MQKVRDLEMLYGSQLVWKIDRYAERMQEAKTNKKVTIFSPPFLTSRHGYKMTVSACLNGDGKGKKNSNGGNYLFKLEGKVNMVWISYLWRWLGESDGG